MKKQFVVIGGTSGIGAEVVNKLLENDSHSVLIGSRHAPTRDVHPHMQWSFCDVCETSPSFIPVEGPLQGLVYCPGNINLKPFSQLKEADFLHDLTLNFLGAIKAIQYYLPHLLQSNKSSVILFSTVAVQQGMPFHTSTASSKGALEALMRSLAAEYAPKIRFNCLAPSLTDTPMATLFLNSESKREAAAKRHPLQEIGSPKDIATLVNFLLSEDSAWITGQVFHVDGGLSTLKLFEK